MKFVQTGSFGTVADGVLLEQVCHVNVHHPAPFLHQIVAVGHLTAAWTP